MIGPIWHCHVKRGQTHADLVALYGRERMLTAVLVLPEPDTMDFARFAVGHGWVTPNAAGIRARCGGPSLCPVCQREKATAAPDPPRPAPNKSVTVLEYKFEGQTCWATDNPYTPCWTPTGRSHTFTEGVP